MNNTPNNNAIPSLTCSPTALELINEAMKELFVTYKALIKMQRDGDTKSEHYNYVSELFHTSQAFILAVERYNALHYGLTQEMKRAD